MKIKFYEYKNCGTCQKALKFLQSKNIEFEKIPIRDTPPTTDELIKMLSIIEDSKKMFNTSGNDYKAMNLKSKLSQLNDEERIKLLNSNGNLVKRPFVLGENFGLVGFKEEEWKKVFK
jgi:arsenate reductase